MTQEEFRKTVARMVTKLANPDFVSVDTKPCKGVHCIVCPIHTKLGVTSDKCMIGNLSIFDAFDIIEAVEEWAKEHPVPTNADKFKEVWGCEPKNRDDMYYCPRPFGKSDCSGIPDEDMSCEECRKAFWEAQYEEPKAEREQS